MKKLIVFLIGMTTLFSYVLVSVKPLELIVKEIYDGDVEILIDPNVNPHTYQLTPSAMKKIVKSDVLIIFGSGFEAWMKKLEGKAKICEVSSVLGKAPLENPHVWLDPVYTFAMSVEIEKCLEEIYPSKADEMRENLVSFLMKLSEETKRISRELSGYSGTLMELRPALYHFVRRFVDVDYITLVGGSESGLSAKKLKEALKLCKLRVRTMIVERNSSRKIAEPLIRSCKLKVIVVDVLGTEAENYFDLLDDIAKAVEEALR